MEGVLTEQLKLKWVKAGLSQGIPCKGPLVGQLKPKQGMGKDVLGVLCMGDILKGEL